MRPTYRATPLFLTLLFASTTTSANPYMAQQLVNAAKERTCHTVVYDGSYQ